MPEPISDSINSFFKATLFGFPIYLIIGIIGIIIYFIILRRKKPKGETYRKISLSKEVKREIELLFEIQDNVFKNKLLTIGSNIIGKIDKGIDYNFQKNFEISKDGKTFKEANETPKEKPLNMPKALNTELKIGNEFYAFRICKKGLVNEIMTKLFNTGKKYFFVDKAITSINPFEVVINPTSQYTNYIDVIIFSEAGKQIINDIAFKITLEKTLEEMVNFIPKMSFLETNLSSKVARYRELSKLEKEKYEGKIEKLTEED